MGEGNIGLTDELQDEVLELGQRQFPRGRLFWKGLLRKDAKSRGCYWWWCYLCYCRAPLPRRKVCFEKRRLNESSRNAL